MSAARWRGLTRYSRGRPLGHQPYIKNVQIFKCPSDSNFGRAHTCRNTVPTGFDNPPFENQYDHYWTSYRFMPCTGSAYPQCLSVDEGGTLADTRAGFPARDVGPDKIQVWKEDVRFHRRNTATPNVFGYVYGATHGFKDGHAQFLFIEVNRVGPGGWN